MQTENACVKSFWPWCVWCFRDTWTVRWPWCRAYRRGPHLPPCCTNNESMVKCFQTNIWLKGCRHSSVDESVPTILPPRVRVPSTPSMLLSFGVKFVLYLSCEKNENKQKDAEFFKKYSMIWRVNSNFFLHLRISGIIIVHFLNQWKSVFRTNKNPSSV